MRWSYLVEGEMAKQWDSSYCTFLKYTPKKKLVRSKKWMILMFLMFIGSIVRLVALIVAHRDTLILNRLVLNLKKNRIRWLILIYDGWKNRTMTTTSLNRWKKTAIVLYWTYTLHISILIRDRLKWFRKRDLLYANWFSIGY